MNIVLDLLFVGVLRMGVGSAALATAISQAASALLCFIRLVRTNDIYQVKIREIRFHPAQPSADYQLWSALRSAELDYFDCQHRGAVQY